MCGRGVVTADIIAEPAATPAVNRGPQNPFDKKLMLASICDELRKGRGLASICAQEGFPSRQTVQNWQNAWPEVALQIACARQIGWEKLLEETVEIADDPTEKDPARTKVRVWTRFEVLKRLDPARYGDKPPQTTVNVGVQVNAMSDEQRERIREKKQRAIDFERKALSQQ